MAEDRDHWQAVVNAVMNLWVLSPWSWLVSTTDTIKIEHNIGTSVS
jgi:hypothetical protein